MRKQILVEMSGELYDALEVIAKRELRPLDQFVGVVLHRYCFGQPDRATDEEVAAYRAMKAESGKSPRINLKAKDRNRLFEKFEGKCYHCTGQLLYDDRWHVDHLVPIAKGGSNDLSNLVLSCARCNLQKRDKMPAAA